MPKNKELMTMEVLNSITDAFQKAGNLYLQSQAQKRRAAIEDERLQREREKFRRSNVDEVYKNIDRAYEYGGFDPISGKNIDPKDSNRSLKRQAMKLSLEEKKLKLEALKQKQLELGKAGPKLKVPVQMQQMLIKGGQTPERLRGMGELISENKDLFGIHGAVMEGKFGRTIGEVADYFGKDDFIKTHNRIQGVNTIIKTNIAKMLKADQGSRPTDFDWKIYEKLLPRISDRYEVAIDKINKINKAYVEAYNKDIDRMSKMGYTKEQLGEKIEYSPIVIEQESTGSFKPEATEFDPNSYLGE